MTHLNVSDLLNRLLSQSSNIRNLAVIAHVDHGKSSLVDSLISMAGIDTHINPSEVGKKRATDTREDEKLRGITIKSTSVSLLFKGEGEASSSSSSSTASTSSSSTPSLQNDVLCNLIDCPGHVDFSGEVTSALRVADGSLVLVDCLSGVSVQTETVLRQSLAEKVRPTLIINKVDRMFLELQMDLEQQYQTFRKIIEDVNVQIAMFQDSSLGDWQLDPLDLNVIWASGFQGWAFSLDTFARFQLRDKPNADPVKFRSKLFGDWYFDPVTSKFVTQPLTADGRVLQRTFVEFVLLPLQQIVTTTMEQKEKPKRFANLLRKLDIRLNLDDAELAKLSKRDLVAKVFQAFIPAGPVLRDLIVNHLPSPPVAQVYRAAHLYSGPSDDATCKAIQACDPQGPLVFYVSKLVPTDDRCTRFYAFGRVFSGTLQTGATILVPQAKSDSTFSLLLKQEDDSSSSSSSSSASSASSSSPRKDEKENEDEENQVEETPMISSSSVFNFVSAKLTGTFIAMCAKFDRVDCIPAGCTGAVLGIEKIVGKTGTVVSETSSFPLREMKMQVSPVVRTAIQTKKPQDNPKLKEALRRLLRTDSTLELIKGETGEDVLAATGELHLEIAINDLQSMIPNCPIVTSQPIVSFRETILAKSPSCLAKSSNKLNRIWITAEPLSDEFTAALENGQIRVDDDMRSVARRRLLVEKFDFEPNDAARVWAFGPEEGKCSNILVDQTSSAQYLQEVKDSIVAGFNWVCSEGVLMGEQLRGVRFNIVDVQIHSDPSHRGAKELIPATRRAMYAALLSASPALQEPFAALHITVTSPFSPVIHSLMGQKRGVVLSENLRFGTPQVEMEAELPFVSSFGLNAELRQKTSGNAFLSLGFGRWQTMNNDPIDKESLSGSYVTQARVRRGLPPAVPQISQYLDKL